jgi:hypothetical protein
MIMTEIFSICWAIQKPAAWSAVRQANSFLAGKFLKLSYSHTSDLNVLRKQSNGCVCRVYFEQFQFVRTDEYVIIPPVLSINSCSPPWLAAVDCIVSCLAVVFWGYRINTPSFVITRTLWNRKPNGRAVGAGVILFALNWWDCHRLSIRVTSLHFCGKL